MKTLCAFLVALLCPTAASAADAVRNLATSTAVMFQAVQDACTNATQPFVVTAGAPFYVGWTMNDKETDSNNVQFTVRADGFYISYHLTGYVDIGAPAPGPICPTGTTNAGRVPYIYRTTSGVPKGGPYTFSIKAWRYAPDPITGQPTQQKEETLPASVPFTAVDPIYTGPMTKPVISFIRK